MKKEQCRYKYILLFSVWFVGMLSVQGTVYAKTVYHKDVLPIVPRIMGMGNGFSAQASGFHSLWTNPAGLAKKYVTHFEKDSEITAFSFTFWTEPYPGDVKKVFDNFFEKNFSSSLKVLNTTGIALGFPISGGYISQKRWGSFGFGIINSFNTDVYTPDSYYSVRAILVDQLQFMAGYAYQFHFSNILLRLGVTARPLFRTYNELSGGEANVAILNSGDIAQAFDAFTGLHGFAIGHDAGLQLEWMGVTFGADIHNIFTPIVYTEAKTADYFSGKATTKSPSDYYVLPLYVNLGIAYNMTAANLIWLEQYFDVTVYLQFTDPFYLSYLESSRKPDFVSRIHTGVEFEILKPFITMQVGANKGGPTFGMGFDIWYVDIAFTIYTQESGGNIRERTTPGFALETAFRW